MAARGLSITTAYKNLNVGDVQFLAQRIGLIGQGNSLSTYSTTKTEYTSALDVANAYGFGSPLHLAARQLFPDNGDGIGDLTLTVYPLEDDDSGVAADGDITPSGAQTESASYKVVVNNIESEAFVIAASATVATIVTAMTAAINAVLEMPIIAVDGTTAVTFTSKWKGVSANDIYVSVDGSTTAGTAFAITQANGGLVNPSVDAALAQIGDVWESEILNCLNIADTTALATYSTFGDGRWGSDVYKPLNVFTGNTEADVDTAITVSDARTTDKTNVQLVAPGSNDLPFVVAARELARIAVMATEHPAHDYGSLKATGLTPGTDGEQWDKTDRSTAYNGGSSTIIVKDSVVNLADTITFYHPTGDTLPAYRYLVDIVKLQNIIYNVDLIFGSEEWDGAPLVPNGQAVTESTAKTPNSAKFVLSALIDSLSEAAIISDPETAKSNITANIDGDDPKKLNIGLTLQLSGNTNTKAVALNFGFYFG